MPQKSSSRAFTLIEILSTIALIAVLTTMVVFFTASYISCSQNVADQRTLTVLNDALTRYKCEGGNVAALAAANPIGPVIASMQTAITWGGVGHQVLQAGKTYPARSISAGGNGSQYHFTRYNTYAAADYTSGGGSGGGGGCTYVVTTGGTAAAYSTDGITWNATTMPAAIEWRVAYGNGTFAACGQGSGSTITNVAAYSADGITWHATTMPSSARWTNLCFGNGIFVAVAYLSNQTAYSTDGITWTAGPNTTSSQAWGQLAYACGKFMTAAGPTLNSNATGTGAWSLSAITGANGSMNIAGGSGGCVVVSDYSPYSYYSPDGSTWTVSSTPLPANGYYKVIYGNGKYMTFKWDTGTEYYSSDGGVTWTSQANPLSGVCGAFCYAGGKFVAVNLNSATAAYSTDGITWTTTTMPSSAGWFQMAASQ